MRNIKVLLSLFFCIGYIPALAITDANSIYHEQSFNDIGCSSVKFITTKTPTATTQVTIGWRVLFQNLTDNSVIYYTTDGSTPSGSFGVGSGTTQVITGQYVCAYGSPKIDVIKAVIPAQPLGTVVKYIIGAWHSIGGDEVFANGVGTACNCGTPANNSSLATVFSYNVDYLIDANGDGGFELGSTFADNGWFVVNSSNLDKAKWFITNSTLIPSSASSYSFTPTGNQAAYVSTANTSWSYYPSSQTAAHMFKDVVLPAGKNNIQLSFRWNCRGRANPQDKLLVYICPSTVTPVLDQNYWGIDVYGKWIGNQAPYPNKVFFLGDFNLLNTGSTGTTAEISIPDSVAGNCNTSTTRRIVFTWINQGVSRISFDPPIAIDDISLKAFTDPSTLSSSGGTFTIDKSLPDGPTNFSSFTKAIHALNCLTSCSTLSGSIIFNVKAGQEFMEDPPTIIQSGTAAFPIIFQKSGNGSNPVIKATGGPGIHDAGITISGADYIIFDGIDVVIKEGDQLEHGYYIKAKTSEDGASNNTIKNTNIVLNRENASSAGILQNSMNTAFTGNESFKLVNCKYNFNPPKCDTVFYEEGNKLNKYLNLDIQNTRYGIELWGKNSADLSRKWDSAIVISSLPGGETKIGAEYTDNSFGDITTYGIHARGVASTEISNCIIQNISGAGIYLEQSTGTNKISNNKIRGITPVQGLSSSGEGIIAEIEGGTNNDKVNIFNNFISDVSNNGIRVGFSNANSNHNIDFNSISVDASESTGSQNSTCISISNINLSTNNIRNNILANYTRNQTGSDYHTLIRSGYSTPSIGSAASICDNNDYYIENPGNGHIGILSSGNKTNFTDWLTALTGNPGSDMNSKNVDPLFNNPKKDLTANAFAINNAADPDGIPWVTTSIDGSPRSATPDIGAKEFVPPPLDVAASILISPGTGQCYSNAETVTASIKNFSYLPFDLSLNPVTVTVSVSGAVSYSSSKMLNTGIIAPAEKINVSMPDLLDMSTVGNYQFTIQTSLTGDVNSVNDFTDGFTRSVSEIKSLPQFVDFTNFTGSNLSSLFPGWSGSPTYVINSFPSAGAVAGIYFSQIPGSRRMVSPKFLANTTTKLEFKMAMNAYFSINPPANGGMLGTVDDKFIVQISTDCGNTFQDLYVYNGTTISSITNSLTLQSFDLSNYAGQECIIAFYCSTGTVNDARVYSIHFDDIFIGEPIVCNSVPDAGIITPALNSVCPGTSTTITANSFSIANGISHQWQSSNDGINFNDIANATGTQVTTGSMTVAAYFRLVTTCTNTGELDYSNIVLININPVPVGNTLVDPIIITGLPYSHNGNNFDSNCWTSTYTGANSNISPDVFYKFTATCSGTLRISMCGGQFPDDALHLLNSSGTQLVYNTNGGPLCTGTSASIQYTSMVAGQTYYIVVEGTGSAQSNYTLTVTQVVSSVNTYFQDNDGDGYGNPNVSAMNCVPLPGYVTNDDDCNDNNPSIHLNAIEICNGVDDDCDGLIDETTLAIAINTSGISCYGQFATITVAAIGGEPPYTGTGTFNVGPGNYTYTITDSRGCSRSSAVVIQEPLQLTCSTAQTNATYWHDKNCTATAYPSGGTPPYTFSWNTQPAQNTQTATKLQGGSSYTVTITDSKGCTVQCTVLINEPSYTCPSIKDFTQADIGEWGAVPSGTNISNVWLYPYFSQVFPAGVVIGSFSRTLKFNCAQAITNFLSTGAAPAQLPNINYINPKGSNSPPYISLPCGPVGPVYKNTLASKTLALLLNTEFDKQLTSFTPSSSVTLSDLVYTASPFAGWQVNLILNEANRLLGQGLQNEQDNKYYSTIVAVIDNILKGKNLQCPIEPILTNKGSSDVLITEQKETIKGLAIYVKPNPSEHQFTLNVQSNSYESVQLKVYDMYGRVVYSANGNANRQYQFGNYFVSGAYIAEIRQGVNRSIVKLVKQ